MVRGVLVLLPDTAIIGHDTVYVRIANPRLLLIDGVQNMVNPHPVPGIDENRVLEAGGVDGGEVQVRFVFLLQDIEKRIAKTQPRLPNRSHQPFDGTSKQSFLTGVESWTIVDVTADHQRDMLRFVFGQVEVEEL